MHKALIGALLSVTAVFFAAPEGRAQAVYGCVRHDFRGFSTNICSKSVNYEWKDAYNCESGCLVHIQAGAKYTTGINHPVYSEKTCTHPTYPSPNGCR